MDCQAWDKGMNYSDQACREAEEQGQQGVHTPPEDPQKDPRSHDPNLDRIKIKHLLLHA